MTEGKLKEEMKKVSGTQIIGYEGPPVPKLNLAEATYIVDEAKKEFIAILNLPLYQETKEGKMEIWFEKWFGE